MDDLKLHEDRSQGIRWKFLLMWIVFGYLFGAFGVGFVLAAITDGNVGWFGGIIIVASMVLFTRWGYRRSGESR